VKVSAEAARRFLVARHLLAPARSLEGGRDGVLEVFRRFGSIQFDPIDVAGRTHDLMLHARVAGYDPRGATSLRAARDLRGLQQGTLFRAFLPPFDPLVWDRGLLGSLFESTTSGTSSRFLVPARRHPVLRAGSPGPVASRRRLPPPA
jgi:uncharacterized protein YcaQ